MDVEQMLATMPAWKLDKWRSFYDLEPNTTDRADWNAAHIVQAVVHDGKTPLSDYRLAFGDTPDARKERRQSVEYQTMVIEAWITTSNAIFKEKPRN